MLEEDNNEAKEELVPSDEFNNAIDAKLMSLPLKQSEKQVLQNIVDAPNKQVLEEQIDQFNMIMAKENAMRVAKMNMLLGKIEDQAIIRFEKRPDQVSNKEMLDYMQVVSNQIDRSQKYIDNVSEKPAITLKQSKTEVNINVGPQLDRDGKERVMDALSVLLKQIQKPAEEPVEVVDLTDENSEEIEKSESDTVLNNDDCLNEEGIE